MIVTCKPDIIAFSVLRAERKFRSKLISFSFFLIRKIEKKRKIIFIYSCMHENARIIFALKAAASERGDDPQEFI